jgi:hypothetical protein
MGAPAVPCDFDRKRKPNVVAETATYPCNRRFHLSQIRTGRRLRAFRKMLLERIPIRSNRDALSFI